MTVSAASLYQIDERGLELRRSYMGMTAAERSLLGGMQAWAERNADGIGAALAEHTFSHGHAGQFLSDYANAKGIRVADLKRGWGAAQAGHFKAIFSEAAKADGFGVGYFEGLLHVGALHSKINLPLKWFIGTYPVFLDLVKAAMEADTPEPARQTVKKALVRSAEAVDANVINAALLAINRIFNYDSQAIVESFYYDTFTSMGVNLKTMGEAGPGRDISDMFSVVRNVMHETLSSFGASTHDVQAQCSAMNRALSETGQAIHELAMSASRVAEGASRQAEVASTGRQAVDQATAAAEDASELGRSGIDAAMEATASLNDARTRIEEAATAITALASRSQQVGGIVEAIQEIARQTNLLALNAAIEAARAGERGKGFAVVAEEVRRLAENAAQSAANAGDIIAGIQGETDDAVELVRDAATRTHAGTDASDRARTTLEEIDGAVGRITLELSGMKNLTTEIADFAEETAASAQEMSATTEQTNASTQEIVLSVSQLSSQSEELSRLTEKLDLAV